MLETASSTIQCNTSSNIEAISIMSTGTTIQCNASINITPTKMLRVNASSQCSTSSNIKAISILSAGAGITSSFNLSLINVKNYSTLRSTIVGTSKLECYHIDNPYQKRLLTQIPKLLRSSLFQESFRVQDNEATRLNAWLQEIVLQLFVETATWRLDTWENELGIETNDTFSIEERKNIVLDKIRYRYQTITKKLLKSIIDKYCISEIYEDFDTSNIRIKTIKERGTPEKLQAIQIICNSFIPCHLNYEIEFTYLPWDELEAALLTFDQADTYEFDELETTFLV